MHLQLIYKPELSERATTNGSDIARMLVVDIGVKEKWAKISEKLDDVLFKGSGMGLSDIMSFQKLNIETCEGKFFLFLFRANLILIFASAAQLKQKDVMDILRAEKFDLAISETMEFCSYGIFHHLNIPSNIVLSPGPLVDYMSDAFGFPAAASHVPS